MLTWLIAGTLILSAPAPKADRKPLVPEGRWTIESWEVDGVDQARRDLSAYVLCYTATSCTLERNGVEVATEAATYSNAGGVHQGDFRADERSGVKKAIWKLDGSTLTVCESAPRGDRPTDYTAAKGSKRSLWVLKRIKN